MQVFQKRVSDVEKSTIINIGYNSFMSAAFKNSFPNENICFITKAPRYPYSGEVIVNKNSVINNTSVTSKNKGYEKVVFWTK